MPTSSPQLLSHLKPIREEFGQLRAVQVTRARIDRYIERRLTSDGKSVGTVNRETALLKRAFRLACERGDIAIMPSIPKLSEENIRSGFFEHGDFEAVVSHLPEYLRDFARFGYFSGWRKGEIASLQLA